MVDPAPWRGALDGWDVCECQKLKVNPEGGRADAVFILWEGWHHHFDQQPCHRQSAPSI